MAQSSGSAGGTSFSMRLPTTICQRLWSLRHRGEGSGSDGSGVEHHASLQRPRKDRRFSPPGVTPAPSYGWPPYKRGAAHGGGARGGASFQQPQRSTLRGRSPRRCGPGCVRESALDAGWHGLPESSGVKPRGAPASRVHPPARRVVAPHGRGRKWRERPRVFWRWCATGEGEVVHAKIHHFPSPFRGRSLHSDPSREGHRALARSGQINRPIRFPHRRRDLRSLRGESVQEAFRGVLVCQGVRKSSLPGKARGFRGAGHRRTLPRRFSRHRGLGHGRGRRERRG